MNCKRCGAEIHENDQFCYNCGFDISTSHLLEEGSLNTPKDSIDVVDKPIKSRFAVFSQDKFDSSLGDSISKYDFKNSNLENNPPVQELNQEEDKINAALEKESFNGLNDSQPTSSHLTKETHPLAKIPKKPANASTLIFAALIILFLGAAVGYAFLGGSGDSNNMIPITVNQTNYTAPENDTVILNESNTTPKTVQNTSQTITPQKTIQDSTCGLCKGNGKIICSACGGSGFLSCTKCGGDGLLADGTSCDNCGGQGKIICLKCQATGYVTCPKCGGTGKT